MRANRAIIAVAAVLLTATVCAARSVKTSPTILDQAHFQEAARIALIERISSAVVCIFDEARRGGGSGVIIDPQGYGLTNFHVVAELMETRRGKAGMAHGKLYDLQVLGIDPGGDVAMFKLEGRDSFPYIELGDTEKLRPGDLAIAMGNPFILSDDYYPTVTMGIISGVHRYQFGSGDALLYSDCLQTDASINPGNSGGPLFDAAGRLIGINGRISVSMRGRLNVGLGYAITINQIKPFIPGLRAGLFVPHGTLQCVVRDRYDGAVVVIELLEDAPAWEIGLRPGDVLLRFDGHEIKTANQYASILGTLPGNWPVPVSFQKPDGRIISAVVRTEPIKLKAGDEFEPDPDLNAEQVQRVAKAYRAALTVKPTTDNSENDEWQWIERPLPESTDSDVESRFDIHEHDDAVTLETDGLQRLRIDAESAETIDGDQRHPLPTDRQLTYRAILELYRRFLTGAGQADLQDVRHVGADRLLEVDDDGNIVQSRTIECLELPLGPHASARFEFNPTLATLARIRARDKSTGENVAIEVHQHPGSPDELIARLSAGDLSIRLAPTNASPDAYPQIRTRRPSQSLDQTPVTDAAVPQSLIDYVNQRVVKLTGAKVGRAAGFGSGIIVSSDGLALTVDSILLDSDNVRAQLADGSLRSAAVVYTDHDRQLALLQLQSYEAGDRADQDSSDDTSTDTHRYNCFDLTDTPTLLPGTPVLAAGNPFKVAEGAEPISLSLGTYSGATSLDATRGTMDFPYRGEVLIIDAITSTPGYPGGALVDPAGRLVGMIGRMVVSRATHTNLNYAIPASVLADFLTTARDPDLRLAHAAGESEQQHRPVYHGIKFFELGYQSNPVYVDRIRRGSPAARSDLKRDDLIIGANGKPVPNLEALERIISDCDPGDTLKLTVMRQEKVRNVSIILEEKK